MFLPECDVPVSPHALGDGAKGILFQDCSEEARGLEVSGCSRLGAEGDGSRQTWRGEHWEGGRGGKSSAGYSRTEKD